MKPKTAAVMSLTLAGALPALASAQMRAEVVEARPYYVSATTTERREICRRPSGLLGGREGQILGGVAGGFIGSEFGSGRGRDIATVAGALLGSEYGRRNFDRGRRDCRVEAVEVPSEAIGGYDVIYEQNGRLWRTRTREHPGAHMAVPMRSSEPKG